MLKFMDGFDHYAPTGTGGTTLQKYLSAAGYTIRNPTNETFAITDGRRSGQYALQFTTKANASVNASLTWGFTSQAQLIVFGFALKASGNRMRICRIENVADVDWDATSGKLKIGNTEGATPLIMNAWYYIEVECDRTANEVRVWVNDTLQVTAPWTSVPQDNRYSIVWGQTSQQSKDGVQCIDDMYALDSSSGARTERLRPVEVATRLPTADTKAEWTPVVSKGNPPSTHAEIAGQLLAMEEGKPYLQSNVSGQMDQYRSNAVLPSNNKIFGVAVTTLARKGDLDDRAIGIKVSAGGQETEVQQPLTESYAFYQVTMEKNPSGEDWNQNSVESSEFGIVTR